MQHGALFGDVDLVAPEHGVDALAQPDSSANCSNNFIVSSVIAVLRVIEQDAQGFNGKSIAAPRVIGE